MSGVPYHAWTHRPKAQGGTDPIEIPGGIDVIHMYQWDYDTSNAVGDTTWTNVCGLASSDGFFERVFHSNGWTTGWNLASGNVNLAVSAEYLVQGWVQFWEDASTGEQRFVAINFGSGNRHLQEYVAVSASTTLLSMRLPVHSFFFGTTASCGLEVWHNHGSNLTIRDAQFSVKRLVLESAGAIETS